MDLFNKCPPIFDTRLSMGNFPLQSLPKLLDPLVPSLTTLDESSARIFVPKALLVANPAVAHNRVLL